MTVQDISAMSMKINSSNLHGKLLINIQSGKKYYEYRLDLLTSVLENTIVADCKYIENKDKIIAIEESDAFRDARLHLKNSEPKPMTLATDLFNREELISISRLSFTTIRGKCTPGSVLPIEMIRDENNRREAVQLMEYKILTTNKSQTYVNVSSEPNMFALGSGTVIDIKKKVVLIPFCGNKVRLFEWSPNGKYIAYAIDNSRWIPSMGKILVIYDVENRKIVLEKGLGDYIQSMAWSPDSDHVVVLIKSTRLLTVEPSEQMALLAGHPVEHDNFSIKIYDFKKEIKSIDIFARGEDAKGLILWQ